jgi:hypothetical protein
MSLLPYLIIYLRCPTCGVVYTLPTDYGWGGTRGQEVPVPPTEAVALILAGLCTAGRVTPATRLLRRGTTTCPYTPSCATRRSCGGADAVSDDTDGDLYVVDYYVYGDGGDR